MEKNARFNIGNFRASALAGRPLPVRLEFWNADGSIVSYQGKYDEVIHQERSFLCRACIDNEEAGCIRLEDVYSQQDRWVSISRSVRVEKAGTARGFRLWWMVSLENDFKQMRYFAPPAIFDKNDLDEDGMEDYFHTQDLMYRDDRLNYPKFMAYADRQTVCLERNPLPRYDAIPDRAVNPETGEKAATFLQKTDIGSLGLWTKDHNVWLCSCYPFFEGMATIGLYISKTVPFGAFYPMETGESFEVGYRLRTGIQEDYHAACWDFETSTLRETKPEASPLPALPEELVRWRLEALNRYYVERDAAEDPNEPAGYVLNCHPQKGEQLENIIQYGFTGQNILNAYNVMRYGYEHGDGEYCRRARRIVDFFANRIHIAETGMFYNLYNVDTQRVSFWWTGLLLPLAYARGDELESLMGPLYRYRKEVIDRLSSLQGAYLRCMNEDALALLRLYVLAKRHQEEHGNWLHTVRRYGDFLLRTQEEDGGWFRAYDADGRPILEPRIWFGGTVYEQKSSTGSALPFLTELSQLTGDTRYLEAAEKGGLFVKKMMIDRVRFNGGVHDSIYAKGQLIDNESILYPMLGMLSLYRATGKPVYLEGASRAAHYCAAWVCLWNVPLPEGSTLQKYGFNSIGMGACDTCGAGYVHPFQLMCVSEMTQIAVLTNDPELMKIASLYWLGCNQTVQMPGNEWGYAYPGLQEEGYLVSWWAVDDPMFAADTGFGYRLKGEGNKTCFPWISAVAVKAYWSLLDAFGTCDFKEIASHLKA